MKAENKGSAEATNGAESIATSDGRVLFGASIPGMVTKCYF